ncbi:unnamed protein product, partial [Phaeothamnion confervicola]
QAVARASPIVGICVNDGVVLCALRRRSGRLQEPNFREKLHQVDVHVVCAAAGLTADAAALIALLREAARRHALVFQEPMPVGSLASRAADVKQSFTQRGGLRPWGASLL